MKKVLIILGVIIGLFLMGIVGKTLFFGQTVVKNTFKTPTEINNRVMNADNAITSYEWFIQQEKDIERLYTQEQNHLDAFTRFKESLASDRSKWSYFDRDEYQRLSSNITAQKDMVNRALQNYNAKSAMVTKNIFKDNLPSNLSRSWYAQKNLIFQ